MSKKKQAPPPKKGPNSQKDPKCDDSRYQNGRKTV